MIDQRIALRFRVDVTYTSIVWTFVGDEATDGSAHSLRSAII